MEKLNLRTVLFDFDGVIGNTMEDNFQAWHAAFAEHGIKIKKDDYFLLEGAPIRDVAKFFLSQNNLDSSFADRLAQSKEHHYLEKHHFSFYEGIEALIATLKRRSFQLDLVSGSNRQRLFSIGINQFLANFDVIVTGDEVQKGKPDPEPFLSAAQKLGSPPISCIVIENAPYGITAAKHAGMYCVAVCSTLDASFLGEADEVVKDIKEVAEIFEGQHFSL